MGLEGAKPTEEFCFFCFFFLNFLSSPTQLNAANIVLFLWRMKRGVSVLSAEVLEGENIEISKAVD